MNLREAKSKFIESWGALGSSWGISRTKAAIHALLLTSDEAITTEDVMEQLNISRGNCNMNLRALVNWGLAYKVMKTGERMEFFEAEKDVHKIALRILKQRKQKELEPINLILSELKTVKGNNKSTKNFNGLIKDLDSYANLANLFLDKIVKSDNSTLVNLIKKLK